jgi:hypothetical protein
MKVEKWCLNGVVNLAKMIRLVISMKKGLKGVPSTSIDEE